MFDYLFSDSRRTKSFGDESTIVGISRNNGQDGPWAFACDFSGNDLSNVASKGEECSGKAIQQSDVLITHGVIFMMVDV